MRLPLTAVWLALALAVLPVFGYSQQIGGLTHGCGPVGYYQTSTGDFRERGAYLGLQYVTKGRGLVVTYNILPVGGIRVRDESRFDLGTPLNLAVFGLAHLAEKALTGQDLSEVYTPFKAVLCAPNSTVGFRMYRSLYVGGGMRTNYFLSVGSGGPDRGLVFWPTLSLGLWHTLRDLTSNSPRYSGFVGGTLMLARPTFWNFDGKDEVGDWTVSFRVFFPFDPG